MLRADDASLIEKELPPSRGVGDIDLDCEIRRITRSGRIIHGSPMAEIECPPSLNRLIGALWLASRLYLDEISFSADEARRMSAALFHRVPMDPTINDMFR